MLHGRILLTMASACWAWPGAVDGPHAELQPLHLLQGGGSRKLGRLCSEHAWASSCSPGPTRAAFTVRAAPHYCPERDRYLWLCSGLHIPVLVLLAGWSLIALHFLWDERLRAQYFAEREVTGKCWFLHLPYWILLGTIWNCKNRILNFHFKLCFEIKTDETPQSLLLLLFVCLWKCWNVDLTSLGLTGEGQISFFSPHPGQRKFSALLSPHYLKVTICSHSLWLF